jgi:hypothetical protein
MSWISPNNNSDDKKEEGNSAAFVAATAATGATSSSSSLTMMSNPWISPNDSLDDKKEEVNSAAVTAATAATGATSSSSSGVVADDNNNNNHATTMTDSTVSVSGDIVVDRDEVKQTMRTSWSVGEAVEIKTDTNLPDFGIIEKINGDGTYDIKNLITGDMESVHYDLLQGTNDTELLSSSATSSSSFPRSYEKRSKKKARKCTVICQVKEIILLSIPCWITKGNTDHIALLVDQDVLALLEQGRISLSDLPQESKVCIEWQSTKKEEQVLVSSVSLES